MRLGAIGSDPENQCVIHRFVKLVKLNRRCVRMKKLGCDFAYIMALPRQVMCTYLGGRQMISFWPESALE